MKPDPTIFLVGANMRSGRLGLVLENESRLLNGKAIFAADPWLRGIPEFPEPPILRHRKTLGRAPRDIEEYRGYWLVSDKTKKTFEEMDSSAFVFSRCVYRLDAAHDGPDLWLCKVIKVLDALDVDASSVVEGIGPKGSEYYGLLPGGKIVLRADYFGRNDIFGLENSPQNVFCSRQFKQRCESDHIRNIVFNAVDVTSAN